jgi:hypothetical protein
LYSLTGGVSKLCTQLGMFTARAALVAVHFAASAPKRSLLELASSSGSAQQEQLAAPTGFAAVGQGPLYYWDGVSGCGRIWWRVGFGRILQGHFDPMKMDSGF